MQLISATSQPYHRKYDDEECQGHILGNNANDARGDKTDSVWRLNQPHCLVALVLSSPAGLQPAEGGKTAVVLLLQSPALQECPSTLCASRATPVILYPVNAPQVWRYCE